MHFLALAIGFCLDRWFGDPLWMPHPIVAMGKLIAWLEKTLRSRFAATEEGERKAGIVLVCIVVAITFTVAAALVSFAFRIGPPAGLAVEAWLVYQLLAARSLRDASMDVYRPMRNNNYAAARTALGRIVGRDTHDLYPADIARATVETIAENTSDGVIAPMLYFALGGVPLAMVYKAINTMDSMLGYKNDRYLHFGRAAAKLDDFANFLPARLTAWLMIASSRLMRLDWKRTLLVYLRDKRNHSSPNAGHPEAACAGALGVRLGGDSLYGGKLVHKPAINFAGRECMAEDIPRANRLLYSCSWLMLGLCLVWLWAQRTPPGSNPWL